MEQSEFIETFNSIFICLLSRKWQNAALMHFMESNSSKDLQPQKLKIMKVTSLLKMFNKNKSKMKIKTT